MSTEHKIFARVQQFYPDLVRIASEQRCCIRFKQVLCTSTSILPVGKNNSRGAEPIVPQISLMLTKEGILFITTNAVTIDTI